MSANNKGSPNDLLQFALVEIKKAFVDAQSGKAPTQSYNKLKKLYDTLSEAEKKRELNEITEEDIQKTMSEEVDKLKEI